MPAIVPGAPSSRKPVLILAGACRSFGLQAVLGLLLVASGLCQTAAPAMNEHALGAKGTNKWSSRISEGVVVTATVDVGPFDLHRKYNSMEGPYLRQLVKVGDLINTGKLVLPESLIKFVEGATDSGVANLPRKQPTFVSRPAGLIDTSRQRRQLYWLKGATVEVLDEHDRPMPNAEFFCHLVVFVDKHFRNLEAFSQGEPVGNDRLLLMSQGLTEFFFPKGFAVPVATDESWVLSFQAANRTSQKHRRVKHRLTLFFIKDSAARSELKALHWYMPYVAVMQSKNEAPACSTKNRNLDCMAASSGACAPNSVPASTVFDALGRKQSGHWVVPPGTHTYKMALDLQPGLSSFAAQNRTIHGVWCHVHPLCSSSSLTDITGKTAKAVYTSTVKTDSVKGLEIKHIDSIITETGIPILKGHRYQLEATYVNNTKLSQDSMINHGVFCRDLKFVRPTWADDKK